MICWVLSLIAIILAGISILAEMPWLTLSFIGIGVAFLVLEDKGYYLGMFRK